MSAKCITQEKTILILGIPITISLVIGGGFWGILFNFSLSQFSTLFPLITIADYVVWFLAGLVIVFGHGLITIRFYPKFRTNALRPSNNSLIIFKRCMIFTVFAWIIILYDLVSGNYFKK